MVYQIIYLLVLSEAILRCLYFWQLKEYRFDRFREGLRAGDAQRYFLPGRHWLRPRLTAKIILLFLMTLILSRQFIWWLAYLLAPMLVAVAVAFISPITDAAKTGLVLLAKLKLVLFHRQLLVIGVTGSYGKTSTKEILAHILAAKFKVTKTYGTENTLIGVAKAVLKMPRSTQVLIAEMGAYKTGEIQQICRLVKPKIGILTGINEQHLALFGSQAKIIQAKSELLLALPADGLAVINGVNPLTKNLRAGQAPVKYYGYAREKTNLLGQEQQLNISAAVTVARYLGVKQFDLTHTPQFKTAITRVKGLNGATIINDSYNSNPDGWLAAINLVKSIPAKNKILISPGIIELGRASQAVHQQLVAAARLVFDEVVMTKPDRISEAELLVKMNRNLTKNHLLLIEGRFSAKFIQAICSNQS